MSLTKVSYSMVNSAPLSVLDYGASTNATAVVNTAAFVSAVAAAISQNKSLEIPAGTYLLTANGVNFAGQGLTIFGHGNDTILQFTGTGQGFVLNGGADGAGVGAMSVSNLRIVGNPNITDGFYQAGVFRSTFRNIEVRECNNNAFTILHGVSNQYDTLKYSTNEAAQTTTPSNGLVLNNNGTGAYTADCTFINCIMEGFPGRGCYIVDGSGNVFVGGTFEGVAKGLEISALSARNKFVNVWLEANTTNDAEIYGNFNMFDGCYFGSTSSSLNIQLVTAGGTVFNGGFIRAVNMQVTSSDTTFLGCGLSDNAGLAFQGIGTYKRLGCTKLDVNAAVVGIFNDVVGESGSFTATASGLTTTPTGLVYYHKLGNTVTLMIPTISGTSNATTFDLNILPESIRPSNTQKSLMTVINNGAYSVSYANIQANGYIVLWAAFNSSSFVSSGTKGVSECTLTYLLN